jgi:uncharacterized protein (DUF488 family)
LATLYTIGHGARSTEEFVALLGEAGIGLLVDVRAVPRSRRHPHFGYGPLGASLQAAGIGYDWRGGIFGGLRRGGDSGRHPALAEPAFRAYAEHMECDAFAAAARELIDQALGARICLMCAERDPRRCHRSFIADWLAARGHRVVHLLAPGESVEHLVNGAVRMENGVLHYVLGGPQMNLF